MEQIEKLETMISGWFKDLPRLPKGLTDWLADNVWWLTIVGVVLSVFAVFSALSLLMLAFGITGLALGGVYGGYAASAVVGVALISVLASIAGFVVTTIIMVLAISPLKEKKKKGWTLLFVVLLLSFAFSVVANLISFNVVGILWAVIWAVVEAYVLFEIRGYFGVTSKKETKKVEKA